MKLALYKAKGAFFDRLVRLVTRSQYSHCELVIEGVSYSSSPRDGGVRKKVINYSPESWDVVEIADKDTAYALATFDRYQGQRYDYLGAIGAGIPLLRYINAKNKKFCSELVGMMLDFENHDIATPEKLAVKYKGVQL